MADGRSICTSCAIFNFYLGIFSVIEAGLWIPPKDSTGVAKHLGQSVEERASEFNLVSNKVLIHILQVV